MELISYDMVSLRRHLERKTAPESEAALLKFTAGLPSLPSKQEDLFILHFSLYHALYRIKHQAGAEGWYLHLDPMRIRLIRTPGTDACHQYNADEGTFCPNAAVGFSWCMEHKKGHRKNRGSLSFDPLLDFYSNPENITFGKSDLLRKLMKGIRVYAFRKGEIDGALAFFNLGKPTRSMIQKRYHELAKKYHPDRNAGDDSLMKRLNQSYQVLCEVFVV